MRWIILGIAILAIISLAFVITWFELTWGTSEKLNSIITSLIMCSPLVFATLGFICLEIDER